MSGQADETIATDQPRQPTVPRARRPRATTSLLAHGEPMVWLTGGALAVALMMIVGLLGLIVVEGMRTFWPVPVVRVTTSDGQSRMGEVSSPSM